MHSQKIWLTIKWMIVMGTLLNLGAFLINANAQVPQREQLGNDQSLKEESTKGPKSDFGQNRRILNNVITPLGSSQPTVASAPSGSPFFAPHQYSGVDTDFSNDKAFFLTKEGTFFPKATYSKLAFYTQYADFIKARILGVNDVTGRILRVYQGSTPDKLVLEYEERIGPNQENFVSIEFNAPATNLYVVFEIYYGAYTDKGWMLEWVYFKNSTSQQYDQFFPRSYISEIETQFIGGFNTRLDLQIVQFNDEYNRFVSIYVDGTLVLGEQATSSGWFTLSDFSLGNFAERTIHNLTIRIRSGNNAEFGWELTKLKIGYTALHVEVAWMDGYKPPLDIFDTISSYFEDNGYERLKFYTNSSTVPLKEQFSIDDLDEYYNMYSWVRQNYPRKHRYMVFGKYTDSDALGFAGFNQNNTHNKFYPYAFVAVQAIRDLENPLKHFWWWLLTDPRENIMVTAMQELGHTLGLLKMTCDSNNACSEYYDWGNRDISVMNNLNPDNSLESPLYSRFWWVGDGRWWESEGNCPLQWFICCKTSQ